MSSLTGIRVLVLRPEGRGRELAELLEAHGAEALVVPAIRILPPPDWAEIDSAVRDADSFDWIVFTSPAGVESVMQRPGAARLREGRAKVAAIGSRTAEELTMNGVEVDWMPSSYTTETLAEELPGPGPVCVFRAEIADDELDAMLEERGFTVRRVDAYRTEPADPEAVLMALELGVDVVALTSASIADAFAKIFQRASNEARAARVCSIGPATSSACGAAGLDVHAEATPHTAAGVVDAIAGMFERR